MKTFYLITPSALAAKITIFLFLISMVLMIHSCEGSKMIDIPISGEIVGTICCKDTINQRIVQGYYIITDNQDSILTFNEEVKIDTYYGVGGCYGIFNQKVPFTFTYELLTPMDDDYVHYFGPVSNAYFPAMQYRPWHFKQARVIPQK